MEIQSQEWLNLKNVNSWDSQVFEKRKQILWMTQGGKIRTAAVVTKSFHSYLIAPVEILHWDSTQQQCQQNMVLSNYENELISLVWYIRKKTDMGTQRSALLWSSFRILPLQSRFLHHSLSGDASISPAPLKKSFIFLLPKYTAKLLTTSTSWKPCQLSTCITEKVSVFRVSELPVSWGKVWGSASAFHLTALKNKAENMLLYFP